MPFCFCTADQHKAGRPFEKDKKVTLGTQLKNFVEARLGQNFATIVGDPFATRPARPAAVRSAALQARHAPSLQALKRLPVAALVAEPAHLYLWTDNARFPAALELLEAWGFTYKTNLVCRLANPPDPAGGRRKPFREVTQLVLFGVRGKKARTLPPGRRQVNFAENPRLLYEIVEACSPGPYLELFSHARARPGWVAWRLG
jgi:N6-adenosine-specific RNA methylase IME4